MNVVIIGSGVIGSVVAEQLFAANIGNITMLEAGPSIPMADASNWFNVINGGQPPYENCYDTPEDFTATADKPSDMWNIVGGRIIGRGGSTLHWGGWLPRFQPEDFLYKTNTGQGLDWPYTYTDLEPYYCQAENFLGVAGDSTDQNPWRSKPYPYPAAKYPLLMEPVITALDALNVSYCHMPVSRYGKGAVDRTPCMTIGTCKYCPISGRYTGDQSVDKLQQLQNDFTLILNAPALEVKMESRSKAQSVTYMNIITGQKVSIEADLVFVCAGALETPKILQNSCSGGWNNGVGNDNDLVGRYLMASPYFYANGDLSENPEQIESELGFPSLASRAFDTVEYQKSGGKFYFNADYATPNLMSLRPWQMVIKRTTL
ncbi:MAG: GMC family oxidoreductase N-terminal domain-containing protein [Thalassotalea sp.]